MARRRRFSRRRQRKSRLPRRNTFVFILWCVVLIQGFFLLKYFVKKPGLGKDASIAIGPYPRSVSSLKVVSHPAEILAPQVAAVQKVAVPAVPKVALPVTPPKVALPVAPPKVAPPKITPPVLPPPPPPIAKPLPPVKIAIVLDDWGYSLKNASYLDEIKQTLNLSILPNLPYSAYIAKLAHRRRFEVLLHMPMEPYSREGLNLEKGTILTSMNASEIKALLSDAIKSFPYIRGVSNHMGSKATEDEHIMNVVLKELRHRRFYFLDSYTAHEPASFTLAKKVQVKSNRRDVFLDNVDDYEYIKNRIYLLAQVAKRQGYAIGIGHDRTATLRALRDVLPDLEKKGFRFVRVSELVK